MEKYRITSETTNQTSTIETTHFIERKKWYGWRKLKAKEGVKTTTLTFKSYEEAEQHMIKNYFGHGWFYKPYSNVYHYNSYTYSI